MKTILYIGQNHVKILQINKKKNLYSTIELQAGTVLNGVILETNKLRESLLQLERKTKKVTLVIDSSNILAKKLQLPKVSKAKLQQMVKGEFDLFHTEQNYQYDTNVLDNDSPMTVMGYAINQDIVDTYIQVCKECGMAVERVEFLLNGLINYIARKPQFRNRTFLFNVISGEYLLSLLFEDGKYKLSNRIRLLHLGEGELFYQELYSRLSAMIQFSSSERLASTIASSYYIGISKEDVEQFEQYVDGRVSVSVQAYEDSDWDMDYFLPALATYKNKQDINFAIKHHEIAERNQKRGAFAWKTALMLVVLGSISAHSFLIFQNYNLACEEFDEVQAISTDADTLEKLNDYNNLLFKNTQVEDEILQYDALFTLLASGGIVEKEVLTQVFNGSSMENFAFDFVSGSVYIHGAFRNYESATDYAAKLREKGFFVEMDYDSFYLNEGGADEADMYHFIINATYGPIIEAPAEEVAQ